MPRILITHASRAGATSDVADIIATSLRERGHVVVVANCKEAPAPEGFDLVVSGSGIHAGAWYGDAISWLSKHADALKGRIALFNVCLNAANPDKIDEALGYNSSLAEQLTAVGSASFAGRFMPERIGFFKRLFLRTMQQKPMDHVDPAAIRAWASDLDKITV